jgi:hypothetical protein
MLAALTSFHGVMPSQRTLLLPSDKEFGEFIVVPVFGFILVKV